MNLGWPGRSKGPALPLGSPRESEGREQGGEGAWTWSWQNRRLRLLMLVGLVGLLLMTMGSPGAQRVREGISPSALTTMPGAGAPAEATGGWPDARQLSRDLEEALSRIQGAGRVHVLLTMETSAQQVYAGQRMREYRRSDGAGGSPAWDGRENWQPVLVRGAGSRGEEGLVQMVKAPQIRGVVVVAQGAADPGVRRSLLRAVAALTGLGAHRVAVLPGR